MSNPGSIIQKTVAAPAQRLAVPDGDNGFAAIGEGLTQGADALARNIEEQKRFAAAQTKARDQSALVDARLKSSAQLDDLSLQFQRDPDPATATARFAKAAQDTVNPYFQTFQTQEAKDSFALDAGQMLESRRMSLADHSFHRESDAAIANVDAAGEIFARQAAYATNAAERDSAIANYTKSVMGVADAGMMDHEAAQRKVDKFRTNLALYDGRALIEKSPAHAKEFLSDPHFLPDLDPLARVELVGQADAKVKQAQREARAAMADARMNAAASLADLDATTGSGLPVSQDVIDQARHDVRASGDPRLALHLEHSLHGVMFADSLRGATPREVEGGVAKVAAAANAHGADASLAAAYRGGQKFLETMNTRLGQDPLAWAAGQGVVAVQPLNLNGQDSAQAWQQRIRAGDKTAQHYGVAPHYLTAAEAQTVRASLAPETDARTRLQTLHNLVGGLGSKAIPELQRLGASPALITAGGLLTAGPAHARTAADIINGDAALAAGSKGGDGQSALRPTAAARAFSVTGASHQSFGLFGGGVSLPQGMPQVMQATSQIPGEAARISAAADAIYASRASARGLSGHDASIGGAGVDLYQRALQEAAGARFEGTTQMGGVTSYNGRPVIVPAIVAADAFEGIIQHLTAADLAHASRSGSPPVDAGGKPVSDELLRKSYLVTVGDGLFGISTTDPAAGAINRVNDAKGRPYNLNFPKALTLLQARAAGGGK